MKKLMMYGFILVGFCLTFLQPYANAKATMIEVKVFDSGSTFWNYFLYYKSGYVQQKPFPYYDSKESINIYLHPGSKNLYFRYKDGGEIKNFLGKGCLTVGTGIQPSLDSYRKQIS